MLVQRTSPVDGAYNTIDIPNLTQDMMNDWQQGMLIQDAMPDVSIEHREFLITGYTVAQQEAIFAEPEE